MKIFFKFIITFCLGFSLRAQQLQTAPSGPAASANVSPTSAIAQTIQPQAESQVSAQTKPATAWWAILLDKNPGVVTIAISSFLLPVIVLLLNNLQIRRMKRIEVTTGLEKLKGEKKIQLDLDVKSQQRNYENIAHSSLIKILFEVQLLHIELSGICVNADCLEKATAAFKVAFSKNQSNISDNQVFLPTEITNRVYSFYRLLAELLIELEYIRHSNLIELAIASVFAYSKKLADEIIAIQEFIVSRHEDILNDFNKNKLDKMRNCCGDMPSPEVFRRYVELRAKMTASAAPLPITIAVPE